jgi:ATP-dependent RNA helicase DDX56/DBP9
VQEFNRGVFNYLIATDESGLEGLEKDEDDEESEVEGERKQSKSQRESLSTRAELWYKGTH